MEKLWKNVADYQGTDFAIGRTLTADGWRKQALDWADTWEDFDEFKSFLETATDKDVIDYINNLWEIHIIPEEEWSEKEKLLEEKLW